MRRRPFRRDRESDGAERAGELPPLGRRQDGDRVDQAFLGRHRRPPQHAAPAGGQRQALAAAIVTGCDLRDQPAPDQPLDDDRDRALMGEGQRRQVVDRCLWMLGNLLQREQLRAAEAGRPRAGTSIHAQRLHDPAERVEGRAHIGRRPRSCSRAGLLFHNVIIKQMPAPG